MKNLKSIIGLALIALALTLTGCKALKLEAGGAYSGSVITESNQVLQVTQSESALYLADASYKLAYTTVFNVCKVERDNRAEIQKISPKIKDGLDKVRPILTSIDYRWAAARQAYKLNPTPAGLSTIKQIIAEVKRLIPVAEAELEPVYSSLTSN